MNVRPDGNVWLDEDGDRAVRDPSKASSLTLQRTVLPKQFGLSAVLPSVGGRNPEARHLTDGQLSGRTSGGPAEIVDNPLATANDREYTGTTGAR